jgi:ADP-heptose:LPS heptosyltransferase
MAHFEPGPTVKPSANVRSVEGASPRIEMVKVGALCDNVNAFQVVSALKAWLPEARLTWIVEKRLRDLPFLPSVVDEVVTIDTR